MENADNLRKDEEFSEKPEDISEEEFNGIEIQSKQQNVDLDSHLFTPYQIEAIKAMLITAPAPSTKSTKKIVLSVASSSIASTYNRVLESKASNKELVHYLSIINLYPHPHLNLDSLVNFKLSFQDKYLGQAVYLYFSVADKYYDSLSFSQKLSLFYRYIYVFSSHMFADFSIFELFCKVLEKDFLSFFVKKQLYQNFSFFKEFLTRFANQLGDSLVKIGYEYPEYRNFIYCTYRASCNLGYNQAIEWVFQRWNCFSPHSIPYLFYHYDCSTYLKSLALAKFESVVEPVAEIRSCLGRCVEVCSICHDNQEIKDEIERMIQNKDKLAADINTFNSTGKLGGSLDISYIRLLPSIDLKVLSEFLCKEKNKEFLQKFTESFDFVDMNLLEALRLYLSSFAITGESQIINRVLTIFSTIYVRQNLIASKQYKMHNNSPAQQLAYENKGADIDSLKTHSCNQEKNDDNQVNFEQEESKYIDRVKKVAYGFIVINTMLYNPSFEKRPTFDDYLKNLDYTEEYYSHSEYDIFSYDVDDFKFFYESLKSNEMKIPHTWADGYDKYALYKKCINTLDSIPLSKAIQYEPEEEGAKSLLLKDMPSDIRLRNTVNFVAALSAPNQSPSQTNAGNNTKSTDICDRCVIYSFKSIFSKMRDSFMFLSPLKYFEICQMLDYEDQYGKYVDHVKHDLTKLLESCKIYLENYKITIHIATIFIDALEKTEKPKSSVLPDLKSMFAKNSLALQRSLATNSQFSQLVDEITNLNFKDINVCNHNISVLNSLLEARKPYVKQIICKLVLNNSRALDNISTLDEQLQYTILLTSPNEKLVMASDSIKLKFILNELRSGNITDEYHRIFKNTALYNDDAFETFVLFQQTFDDFQEYITVELVQDTIEKSHKFIVKEKFEQQLSTTANLLKFCTSSQSILNIKTAKRIHRDGCPLNDPVFLCFDKIVYLILKAGTDKVLIEYVVCLVNYISDSLVLLIKLFDYMFQALGQINPELRGFLIKILFKRVKVYCENHISCCESTHDSSINSKIKSLANQLYESSFISPNELKHYQVYVKQSPEIFEL